VESGNLNRIKTFHFVTPDNSVLSQLRSNLSPVYSQVNTALKQLQIRGTSLGSNILKIEVEDYPTAFSYDVRFDEFWDPKALFRTETGMTLDQAQSACKYGVFKPCYEFALNNMSVFVAARAR
jgi:hypothetical protein